MKIQVFIKIIRVEIDFDICKALCLKTIKNEYSIYGHPYHNKYFIFNSWCKFLMKKWVHSKRKNWPKESSL